MESTQTQKLEFLGEILECTICLGIPASPIYNCLNGHIICGICRDKVTRCGVCQAELKISILAERLVKQLDLKLKCLNQHSGCNLVIKSTDMKHHLQNYYYRDIICTVRNRQSGRYGIVCGSVVSFKEYAAHLVTTHNLVIKTFPLKSNLTCDNKAEEYPWVVQHDGILFICSQFMLKSVVHFLVNVMGDVETARKYRYEITLSVGKDAEKKICKWECPVQPFHHENLTYDAAVPIIAWQGQFENYKLVFDSEAKIIKVREAKEPESKGRTTVNLDASRAWCAFIDVILKRIPVLSTILLYLLLTIICMLLGNYMTS